MYSFNSQMGLKNKLQWKWSEKFCPKFHSKIIVEKTHPTQLLRGNEAGLPHHAKPSSQCLTLYKVLH